MIKIDFESTVSRLREMNDVLILIHHFPDGDTIGSGYALARMFQLMGKRARVECAHVVPDRYKYITDTVEVQEFEPKFIVAVDVADSALLGSKLKVYVENIDLCIDHHASNVIYAKETYLDSTAAATCEIVYELIMEIYKDIDFYMANAIYTGISTDTGCFKYANTTSKTHIITANLMKTGIDTAEINRVMFDTKTKSRLMLEMLALKNMEFSFDDRCATITITKEMRRVTEINDDDLEGMTTLSRQVEGVLIGITIRERHDNTYKISVRTHEPIDASKFCANFGGGGHLRAAGCEIKGSLEEVKAKLLDTAGKMLG